MNGKLFLGIIRKGRKSVPLTVDPAEHCVDKATQLRASGLSTQRNVFGDRRMWRGPQEEQLGHSKTQNISDQRFRCFFYIAFQDMVEIQQAIQCGIYKGTRKPVIGIV